MSRKGIDPTAADATSLAGKFASGELTAVEILNAHLARIEKLEPRVQAFLALDADEARRQAAELDAARAGGGQPGPLAGVPIAVKDVLCVKGFPTTCGSRILQGYRSPFDATCVARLKAAGAIVVGKTNMDEYAMGSSTEHSAWHTTRNPWALDRVPGGSSGGSAAAVAARMVPLALGTDTGGSIRQPAACTGTVGLKPTYGRVSRYGLVAFASSLDQAGPFARSTRDAALALRVMAGEDPRDMTCARVPVDDYQAAEAGASRPVKGMRIGIPSEFFGPGLDAEVAASVRCCHQLLEAHGARLVELSLPTTDYAIAVYYLVATAEASSNLARFDGVRYGLRDAGDVAGQAGGLREMYDRTRVAGFGPEVKRRIMLGTYALSAGYYDAYYLKAMKVRTLIRRDFEQAFQKVDVIVTPTAPTPAFKLGEKLDDPLSMYLSDIYTVTANLAGIPGLSIPCGFTRGGLPIGCQILGPFFGEADVLAISGDLERSLDVMSSAPALAADAA